VSAAIGFALVSLLFAGVNDVVFKRYSRQERSRGMFVLGIGIVWGILQLLALVMQGQQLDVATPALAFGIAAGAMVTLSNLRAGFGVTFKAGLSQGAHAPTMMLIAAASWIIGGFCYARFREHRVRITRKKLGYSALSGVLVFVIVNSLALALERGQASIVVPIANLSFIVALALSVAMKMERLTMRKTIATVCAAVSIYLLAQLS